MIGLNASMPILLGICAVGVFTLAVLAALVGEVTPTVAVHAALGVGALPVYPQADGRVKLAAGWLIEHAGWKGRDLGPVGMYKKQALVLVNRGGAVADDVRALMRAVQRDVRATFGVDLHVEPVFL